MIRAAAFAILLAFPAAAQPAPVTGLPLVVDGDSLRLPGVEVRLWGIDAPEMAQTCGAPGREWPCGRAAADALRALIAGRPVTCRERTRDRYGRAVAVCVVAGRDLSAAQVEAGMALAYRRYSLDYVPQEDRARAGRLGMHAGPFVAPWDYRRGAR